MIDPVTTVNDQFKVATAADDWKGITSVTTLNDQFAVGKSSSGGRRLITLSSMCLGTVMSKSSVAA